MYQIKYTSGYEIQCIGKGENGLSRVANSNGQIVHTGTYAECVRWLERRACHVATVQNRAYPTGV